MAVNPQIVNTDLTVTWDGVSQRIPRGTLIDVPPGSPLMTILNSSNLTALAAARQSSDSGVSIGAFTENVIGGGNEPSAWPQ